MQLASLRHYLDDIMISEFSLKIFPRSKNVRPKTQIEWRNKDGPCIKASPLYLIPHPHFKNHPPDPDSPWSGYRILCALEDAARVEVTFSLLHGPVGRAPHASSERDTTEHSSKTNTGAQCQCGWAREGDASDGQVGCVQRYPDWRYVTRLESSGSLLRSRAATRGAGREHRPLRPDAEKKRPARLRAAGQNLSTIFGQAFFSEVPRALADVPIPLRFAAAARRRAACPR